MFGGLAVAVVVVLVTRGSGHPAALPTASQATDAPQVACAVSPSGADAASPSPAAAQTDNNPFHSLGARQVPGPNMRTTVPPAKPIVGSFAIPPDPDDHVAAYQDSGVADGPVPAPISYSGPTTTTGSPTTTVQTATTTTTVVCFDPNAP